MNSRIALCAAALAVPLLATDVAFAKGGAKRQTVQMSRTGVDADAAGTITVTHGKRGDTKVITLSHLAPRTTYEVRDSATGALLGTVRTNSKGHAVFNLTKALAKSRAKAASNPGADASGGDPSNVDIVDPTTGDDVLTGDVTPPAPAPSVGYADFSDDAGDQASVFMATDPNAGDDTFSLTFYPADDPNADPTTGTSFYYDLNLDTANGDKLPLDAASVADLAGRAFEIHASDGTVVLAGTLPTLDPVDKQVDDLPPFDGGGNPGDMPGGCWHGGDSFDPSKFADPSLFPNGDQLPPGMSYFGMKSAKRPSVATKDGGAKPFTLFVADADGVLHDAGDLVQESFDSGMGDGSTFDGTFGGGFDPNSPFGLFAVMLSMPTDGSFDLDAFLKQLMDGAGADPVTFDWAAGPAPGWSFGSKLY
jgi:hypothetical protein